MKVALVHDYLKEYGGAERVLQALCELYPEAPIYTAFCVKDSPSGKAFEDKKIIVSGLDKILQWKNLYSPLRFLTPLIWESFDFSQYDLVISSASWYITKGIKVKKPTVHICYCHTPPRWLYGYETSRKWKKFLPIRMYGEILAHFLRQYDFRAAQRPARIATQSVAGGVDYFIANSQEVQARIKKFYRREATVIYPPVNVISSERSESRNLAKRAAFGLDPSTSLGMTKDYYLVVSRLEGPKNIDLAISACNRLGENLWIVGAGLQEEYLKSIAGPTIKFLGRVDDDQLADSYKNCKALICTATDEDFGITPVEAMSNGRPVIAYRGGGYLETVIDGKTGVFFSESTVESLTSAIKYYNDTYHCNELKRGEIENNCRKQAGKFSKERFKKEMGEFIKKVLNS